MHHQQGQIQQQREFKVEVTFPNIKYPGYMFKSFPLARNRNKNMSVKTSKQIINKMKYLINLLFCKGGGEEGRIIKLTWWVASQATFGYTVVPFGTC